LTVIAHTSEESPDIGEFALLSIENESNLISDASLSEFENGCNVEIDADQYDTITQSCTVNCFNKKRFSNLSFFLLGGDFVETNMQ
jgi:hypothetical protein